MLLGSLTFFATLAVALGLGPAGSAASAVRHVVAATPQATAPGHLYVADPGSNSIWRFPLNEGLPRVYPDAQFATGITNPYVAVDGLGYIYASYTFPSGNAVIFKFSPAGAVVGKLELGLPLSGLAADAAGDVFVLVGPYGYSDTVSVYSSFSQAPVATLTGDHMTFLFVGPKQRLYAMTSNNSLSISVFDHPTVSSTPSAVIRPPHSDFVFYGAGTWDERGRLVATYYPNGIGSNYDDNDFDVVSWSGPHAHRSDQIIRTKDCFYYPSEPSETNFPGNPTGIASSNGYLEEACSGDSPARVWVYKTDVYGRQQPVEYLNALTRPGGVALGP